MIHTVEIGPDNVQIQKSQSLIHQVNDSHKGSVLVLEFNEPMSQSLIHQVNDSHIDVAYISGRPVKSQSLIHQVNDSHTTAWTISALAVKSQSLIHQVNDSHDEKEIILLLLDIMSQSLIHQVNDSHVGRVYRWIQTASVAIPYSSGQ